MHGFLVVIIDMPLFGETLNKKKNRL